MRLRKPAQEGGDVILIDLPKGEMGEDMFHLWRERTNDARDLCKNVFKLCLKG